MYCGKRSALSFKEMQRPVLVDAVLNEYECPAKTKPCNEDFSIKWMEMTT